MSDTQNPKPVPPAVCDGAINPKTNNVFGEGNDSNNIGCGGGAINRRYIVEFLLKPTFGFISLPARLEAARPMTIPPNVWSAYTRDLGVTLKCARDENDDYKTDSLLGAEAEALMDCAPVAAAMLVIARVQNRCSLELATGGHHPLSPAKGDRAASARAENFIYEALTTVEWRA